MASNPDNEEILRKTEAIFQESRQAEQPFTVSVPVEIFSTLFASIGHIVFSDTWKGDTELAASLHRRFEEVLDAAVTIRENQGKAPSSVSFNLNAREVDFINERLLEGIGLSRQLGGRGASARTDFALELIRSEMACFIGLNTAFVEAGGSARPAFLKFSQG